MIMNNSIKATRPQSLLQQEVAGYVAHQIRTFRLNAGLTQTQLAKHLYCSYQQLQKYENGQNRLTADRLFMLARLFGVNLESFFPGYEMRLHPLLQQYLSLSLEGQRCVAALVENLSAKPHEKRPA